MESMERMERSYEVVESTDVIQTDASNSSNAEPEPTTLSNSEGGVEEGNTTVSADNQSQEEGGDATKKDAANKYTIASTLPDEKNPATYSIKNNKLYNIQLLIDTLEKYPTLKIRKEGKYYLKRSDEIREYHKPLPKNKKGVVIPTIKIEKMRPIENIISKFCEEVICISRQTFLPLSSQGERTLIWVGKKTATHIINHLNGNGAYLVNRFPGDIFVKDKQVIGEMMKTHMLMRSNVCYYKCGIPKEDPLKILPPPKPEDFIMVPRICRHMVKSMQTDEQGCGNDKCPNFEKFACKHLDIFIPEVQSFCSYNALQDFANRLDDDLKGQKFMCKPAYFYKGLGQRVIDKAEEFKEFYHMTEGKETSRHDFMVQRIVDSPRLHDDKKFDIRSFLLVVVLRYRRVVAFVHYGFARLCGMDYDVDTEPEEPDEETLKAEEEDPRKRSIRLGLESKVKFEMDMRKIVATWTTKEEKKDREERMMTGEFYTDDADRSIMLEDIFTDEEEMTNIKAQIKHIATRVVNTLENKIWERYGCYQVLGLDLCVNEANKVWLLEVNSHPLSIVDTLSTTQRQVIPAVMMEAMGLVLECNYKSFHHLRLRKSPTNEFEETGFLFRQNFDFIFSTLKNRRMDYVPKKAKKQPEYPFYERIKVVDEQMREVQRRKETCYKMKLAVREEAAATKRKREGKEEEES